ncbi:MAG: DNA polymerase III subunit beta [Spirochaetia bacterium]
MIKFVCQKDVLMKELAATQKIISIKNNITILSNIVLEAKDDVLIIHASDARLRFETQIPVKVFSQGKIAVFADKFFNIVKNLPNTEIEFSVQDDKFCIVPLNKAGLKIELRWQSTESFPLTEEPEGTTYFRLLQKDFITMINQTFFSVSKDETRIFMNGVFLKKENQQLTMVATDGRRLSIIHTQPESSIPDFSGVIIHPKFLTIIKDLACGEGELALSLSDKTIFAQFDNTKISGTLIDGAFPSFERVIPETQTYQIEFNKNDFIDGLKRTAIFSDDKSSRIQLNFSDAKLEMVAEDNQVGGIHEEIPCQYQGDAVILALNHHYLREPLMVMDSPLFIFEFTDANHAITLRPASEEKSLHVVMPMQLD